MSKCATENLLRAQRADRILMTYIDTLGAGDPHDLPMTLADMLSDLRHWCVLAGISFDDGVERSGSYFGDENPTVHNVNARWVGRVNS